MIGTWIHIAGIGFVWALTIWFLSRRMPRATAIDISSMVVLIYLLIASAIRHEYSIRHLVG